VTYHAQAAAAAAAAAGRADDARALLERENAFHHELAGSTALPPVVLARVRDCVLASRETAEQVRPRWLVVHRRRNRRES
jgi:hypothetical protein